MGNCSTSEYKASASLSYKRSKSFTHKHVKTKIHFASVRVRVEPESDANTTRTTSFLEPLVPSTTNDSAGGEWSQSSSLSEKRKRTQPEKAYVALCIRRILCSMSKFAEKIKLQSFTSH